MLVVLDTTTLTLLLKPTVEPPVDPSTGQPLQRAAERVEYLIEHLKENNATVLIPATVWAEFLVAADESAQEYLAIVKEKANFRVVPFDSISAVEAAIDQRGRSKRATRKLTCLAHGSVLRLTDKSWPLQKHAASIWSTRRITTS